MGDEAIERGRGMRLVLSAPDLPDALRSAAAEAAKAFGMSPFLRFRRIVLPSMLPFAIPGLGNLWLNTTKDSALISVVGFVELSNVTKQAAVYVKYIQGNPLSVLRDKCLQHVKTFVKIFGGISEKRIACLV